MTISSAIFFVCCAPVVLLTSAVLILYLPSYLYWIQYCSCAAVFRLHILIYCKPWFHETYISQVSRYILRWHFFMVFLVYARHNYLLKVKHNLLFGSTNLCLTNLCLIDYYFTITIWFTVWIFVNHSASISQEIADDESLAATGMI